MTDVQKIENAMYDLEEYISVPDAAALTGLTKVTMITYCKKYKIGIKVGGRWKVNPDKLALLLKGALKSGHHK